MGLGIECVHLLELLSYSYRLILAGSSNNKTVNGHNILSFNVNEQLVRNSLWTPNAMNVFYYYY